MPMLVWLDFVAAAAAWFLMERGYWLLAIPFAATAAGLTPFIVATGAFTLAVRWLPVPSRVGHAIHGPHRRGPFR